MKVSPCNIMNSLVVVTYCYELFNMQFKVLWQYNVSTSVVVIFCHGAITMFHERYAGNSMIVTCYSFIVT